MNRINDFEFEIEVTDEEGNEVVKTTLSGELVSILDVRHGIPDNPHVQEKFAEIHRSFDRRNDDGDLLGNDLEDKAREFFNRQQHSAKDCVKSKEWFAVIGYEDRVEVMEGEVYHATPPRFQSDERPEGWVWAQSIDKKDAPNAATAVYQAVLKQIPVDALYRVLSAYLESENWKLSKDEAEEMEEIDRFLQDCGQRSLFAGTEKGETDYGYVIWTSKD